MVMGETLEEFKRRNRVPANRKTEYNIRNSWGVYDFYKYYRKHKPEGNRWVLTESQFFSIFRRVNELLVDHLIRTGELEFPYNMGKLVLFKKRHRSYIDPSGKQRTTRSINWDKTLELWYNDDEAYKNKTLVYFENADNTIIRYMKKSAIYRNKYYYEFKPNRDINRRVKSESVVSLIINRELSKQIKGLYDG